ncbi:MAG TPA: hypothetical protein VGW58_11860 [Pyrinomonadaceae bacterium]|nr:hypothetical protein [Pyrinomonadaceae bacterium]
MDFADAVQYLLSLGHETLTIKLGLRNTELLLAALDHPERAFPSVQIAGTNGKVRPPQCWMRSVALPESVPVSTRRLISFQ